MSIEEKEVRKIAGLARLKLTAAELETYRQQLSRILDHMDELSALDTSKTEPTAHVLGLVNVMREDEPKKSNAARAILDNAPACEGPYVKVPKVIE